MKKTYITITYIVGNREETASFVRPRSAKRPTEIGAARMIARHIGSKPSEVSVQRIAEMVYEAR